jgi:hypothetical protein
LHVIPHAHAAVDDPLQALYDEVPALAELAELLGHGGIGGSPISFVVAALMKLPPGCRAAAASALLARLLRARRERRAARSLVLPTRQERRGSDPLLTAIRVMARALLSTLLSLYLAASWSDEAAAWEGTLQDAMDEIREAADVPPDPAEFCTHRPRVAEDTPGEEHAHTKGISPLSGRGTGSAPGRFSPDARLVALIVRAHAADLSVPLPDGMNLDLSVTALEDFALEIEELELPLPPRI